MYVEIKHSNRQHKKYVAIFYDDDKKKIKTIHFGDNRYQDFTQNGGDEQKRANYINRHFKNEDWENPMTAASLSRYILWEYKQVDRAIYYYLKRFGLKEY